MPNHIWSYTDLINKLDRSSLTKNIDELLVNPNLQSHWAGKSSMCTQSYAYNFRGFLTEHCSSRAYHRVHDPQVENLLEFCFSSLRLSSQLFCSHVLLSELFTIGTMFLVLCFFLGVMVGEKDLIFTFVWD